MRNKLIFLALILCSAATVPAADGDLDLSFNGTGFRLTDVASSSNDVGRDIFVQPDGKIMVAASCNGRFCALRYNADGTLDTTFSGDGIAESSFTAAATAGGLQADGRVVVAGLLNSTTAALTRFNSDGTVDTTFGTAGQVTTVFGGTNPNIRAVLTQSDGKIVVVGTRNLPGPGDLRDIVMARYNLDGSPDTTFDGDGILISNLTPAATEVANDAVLQPDGKIVICGSKADSIGFSNFLIARYNSDGSVDTTFDGDGFVDPDLWPSGNDFANHVTLSPIGRIIAGGLGQDPMTLQQSLAMLSYRTDGTPDSAFDGDGRLLLGTGLGFTDAVVQPDLRIVAAASVGSQNQVMKIDRDGSLDTSFSLDGVVTLLGANKVALQADGKIVTTGQRTVSAGNAGVFTARLLNTIGIATAANVSIRGRVMTNTGLPLRNATVIITGAGLEQPRMAISNGFGYFAIEELPAGETYVVSVYSKRYLFQARILTLNDDLNDLEFVADDESGIVRSAMRK